MVRVPLVVHDLPLVVGGTERENLFKNEINSFKYHNNVTKVQSKITHEIAEICFVSISACYTVMFMHVISYRLKSNSKIVSGNLMKVRLITLQSWLQIETVTNK